MAEGGYVHSCAPANAGQVGQRYGGPSSRGEMSGVEVAARAGPPVHHTLALQGEFQRRGTECARLHGFASLKPQGRVHRPSSREMYDSLRKHEPLSGFEEMKLSQANPLASG